MTDRGGENSRTFKNNVLVYRILDDKGQKVGIPINASDIYNNPGSNFLSRSLWKNEPLKQPHKQLVKNAIDLYFIKHKEQSLEEMKIALQKEKIRVVLRQFLKKLLIVRSLSSPAYPGLGITTEAMLE